MENLKTVFFSQDSSSNSNVLGEGETNSSMGSLLVCDILGDKLRDR